MAQFLDPNADGTQNAWTKSSGTVGWSLIDDATRQPSTPNTTDNVNEVTAGDQQETQFATGTFVSGTWTLWAYCKGGTKRKIQYAINTGGGFGTLADLVGAGQADQWVSKDVSSLITNQTTLDAFQVKFQCVSTAGGGGATAVFVYATYLEGPSPSTTYFQTIAVANTGVSALNGALLVSLSLPSANVGSATLNKVTTFSRVISVVNVGVSSLSRVATYFRALGASSISAVTLNRGATYFRPLNALCIGVASLTKGLLFSIPMSAISVGMASLSSAVTISQTLAATATSLPLLSAAVTIVKTLAVVAVGLTDIQTQFIAGEGGTTSSHPYSTIWSPVGWL